MYVACGTQSTFLLSDFIMCNFFYLLNAFTISFLFISAIMDCIKNERDELDVCKKYFV